MGERIPRLEMAEMNPALATYLKPRVERLKYLGEFFKCGAHSPEVMLTFMHFTEALKASLPDKLTEAIVLSTASSLGNHYELHQHERLSVRLGFGRAWIAEVERLQPDEATLLSENERAVQRYALAAIKGVAPEVSEAFAAVAALLSPKEAMTVPMLVGRYMTHALVVNSLRLDAPVPSIWQDGFGRDAEDAAR